MSENTTQTTEEPTQQSAEDVAPQGTAERMFTQEEVNKLVGEARKKVRSQYEGFDDYKAKAEATADYEDIKAERDKLSQELEYRVLLDKVSEETGIPKSLIHGETEEEMTASAKAVSEYIETIKPKYPEDKGGGTTPKPQTRASLSDIKDPIARLNARAQIIESEIRHK